MSYTIKGKSSAFLFFKEYCCRENKRQNKTDYKDIRFAVKCSEMWNAMTEEKKRKFRMMVECDKKRFIVESKRMKKQLKGDFPKKPKSALFFYMESINCEAQSVNVGAKVSLGRPLQNAAERFRKLTDEEKQQFIDLAKEDGLRYKREKRKRQKNNKKRESISVSKIRSKEFVSDSDSD